MPPTLDVSKVLMNPKFRDDSAVVIRSTEKVNEHGETVLTKRVIPISGVIIAGYALPGGDGGLIRSPDGERFSNGLTIATQFPLQAGDTELGITADVIRWRGCEYTVTAQNDYSSFAGGYILALADQKPVNS